MNLRNLATLPRWGEIPYLERREIQALVDWLYGRMDPRQSEGVALLSDLIRVCILLASHAPVNEIVSGRVQETAPVKTGGRVTVGVDPVKVAAGKVRVGMPVMIYREQRVVAQAVVEDIVADRASTRIVNAIEGNVQLQQNDKVQFGEPQTFFVHSIAGTFFP